MLQSSHFRFERAWASVIEGDMEGVYAWVGANYASGALEVSLDHATCCKLSMKYLLLPAYQHHALAGSSVMRWARLK